MRCRFAITGMVLAGLLVFFAPNAGAQIPQITLMTQTPKPGTGHDYIHGLNDTVDPSSGNLTIKLSVPVPAGRQLSIPFYVMYSSGQVLTWLTVNGDFGYEENHVSPVSDAGWTYTVPMVTYAGGAYYDPNSQGTCNYSTDYVFFDAEGNGHTESVSTADPTDQYGVACDAGGYYEVDVAQNGSFLSGSAFSGYLPTDADGTTYGTPSYADYFPTGGTMSGQIEDRNGNLINIAGPCCTGAFTYSDTVGRTVLSSSGFGSGTTTIQSSKFANAYTVHWGTASLDYTVNITNVPNDPRALDCPSFPATQAVTASVPAIQSITLPNGQSYAFTYDPTYGRVSKVTYPSGAYVRYVWGMRQNLNNFGIVGQGYICVIYASVPVVTDRYVSPDGTTETEQQHFTYSSYYPSFTPSTTEVDTDLTTNQVVRTITYNYTTATTDPVPFDEQRYGTPPFIETTVVYSSGSSTLRTVSKTWHNDDPRELASQKTTLEDGSTSSETDYCYNSFYQVTEKDEFDYGTGGGGATCNGTTAPGLLLRKTVTNYASFGQMSGQYPSQTYSGQWINDRPLSVITYDGSNNRAAETDYTYGNATTGVTATLHDDSNYSASSILNRGNLISVIKECFPNCPNSTPTTTFTYDDTGQVLSQTDPNLNVTNYSYADNFATGTPPGATDGYLTQITYPPTNGVSHIEKYSYNYEDGTFASSTDQNNQVTSYAYNDSMDRLTSVSYPDGGGTQYSYQDTAPMTTTATEKITSSLDLVETSTYDGLDREIRVDKTNGEQTPYDEIDACYDGLGRVSFKSYSYQTSSFSGTRCSNNVTPGDAFGYDAIDRQTSVTHSDGSVVSTSYATNATTVTDEVGMARESFSDGLGRLTEVVENPNGFHYITNYTYNALDDLMTVAQSGSRNRTFGYDSLSRLTSSTNPETNASGAATSYSYDGDSNLVSKTDARSITSTYSYDALNRLTQKSYSDGTHSVTYSYDQSNCLGQNLCYNVGHRTGMTDAAGSEAWSYDPIGRAIADQRATESVTRSAAYSYDFLGSPTSVTYPSGRTINYTPNAADRLISAVDASTGVNYTQNVHYAANGVRCWIQYGSGVIGAETFNSRQQPLEMQATTASPSYPGACSGIGQTGNVLDLQYCFTTWASGACQSSLTDNGNVMAIANNRDTTRSQSFQYDALNRIVAAETESTYSTSRSHCWGESYLYDNSSGPGGAWGNLTAIGTSNSAYNGCTQEFLSQSVTADNQISGFCYDAAGNLLGESACPVSTYTYNAENELVSTNGVNYTYDGDGRRVAKSNGTIYWYGLSGQVLEESDGTGALKNEYVYFGGKRIARIAYPY